MGGIMNSWSKWENHDNLRTSFKTGASDDGLGVTQSASYTGAELKDILVHYDNFIVNGASKFIIHWIMPPTQGTNSTPPEWRGYIVYSNVI